MKTIVLCMAAVGLASGPAFAVDQVQRGNTTLIFDEGVAAMLADCELRALKPGSGLPKVDRLRLRAIAGAVSGDSEGPVLAEVATLAGCPSGAQGPRRSPCRTCVWTR